MFDLLEMGQPRLKHAGERLLHCRGIGHEADHDVTFEVGIVAGELGDRLSIAGGGPLDQRTLLGITGRFSEHQTADHVRLARSDQLE